MNILKKNKYEIILAIIVFFIVFINSMTSPIYNVALMGNDANLFYAIGRMLFSGKIAYIDVYDHKGLYLYFIPWLMAFCQYKHIGVFIIYYIIVYINSLLCYKIMRFYIKELYSLLGAFFISILHVSYYFTYGAFEGESLLLPFLTAGFYLGIKYIKNINNNDFSHEPTYMLMHGIVSGVLFLTKPNICLPWFGFGILILFLLIKNKLYKNLFVNIIFGIIGFAIAALPVIIYCIINNCFAQMIDATYLFNMRYSNDNFITAKGLELFLLYLQRFAFVFIAIGLSHLIVLFDKNIKKEFKIFYFIIFILSFITFIYSRRPYKYYANVLMIYFLPLIIFILYQLEKAFSKIGNEYTEKIIMMILFISFFIFSIAIGRNISLKENASYLKCANSASKIYNNLKINKKTAKTLSIGPNEYVYNLLPIEPCGRYLTSPNISYEAAPEVFDEIYSYVKNNKADIIFIAIDSTLGKNKDHALRIIDCIDENYTFIDKENGLQVYVNNCNFN